MASKTSVRQMLNEKGIDNNRIGWNNGAVTVDNQNFMKPTNVYQGTSYADQPTFNQAFSTYQNALQPQTQAPQQTQQQPQQPYQLAPQFAPQQPSQQVSQQVQGAPQSPYQGGIFTPAETDMTWQQRIPYYAQNPEAGQAELQRAQQALGVYTAMGDTQKAQEAQKWISMLGNVVQQTSPQDAQIQKLIQQITGQMGQRQPFDPYASPEFAAQEARSQRAAQQGIRSAQEALGSAGFGRSTVLGERAQGIQNEQEDFLRTQVIPQIIARNEARQQQELQNQIALLNPLQQQQTRADQQERFGIEDQRYEEETEYNRTRDALTDEQAKLEFDEDVRRWGLEYATDKAYKQGQLDISRYNAQTSRMGEERIEAGQNLDNLYRQWESTKVAPEGIPGIEAGTPFPEEGDPKQFEAQVISGMTQFDNAEDALGWITANSEEITRQLGAKGYENMRKAVQSQFPTGDKAAQDIRNRAMSMAQNDVFRWNQAKTPEQREQLIREYEELLRVQ